MIVAAAHFVLLFFFSIGKRKDHMEGSIFFFSVGILVLFSGCRTRDIVDLIPPTHCFGLFSFRSTATAVLGLPMKKKDKEDWKNAELILLLTGLGSRWVCCNGTRIKSARNFGNSFPNRLVIGNFLCNLLITKECQKLYTKPSFHLQGKRTVLHCDFEETRTT